MQPTEQESFGARLAILAEVFAEPMSPTRLEGYVALLDEYPLADLVPALEVCAKHCTYFPRPVDITDAVATVRYERAQQRTKRLIAHAPELSAYHCEACRDTGFVRDLDCPGDGRCHVGRCGQPGHVAYAHGYTRLCHCRATNPVLVKGRETLRAMAPKAQKEHRA